MIATATATASTSTSTSTVNMKLKVNTRVIVSPSPFPVLKNLVTKFLVTPKNEPTNNQVFATRSHQYLYLYRTRVLVVTSDLIETSPHVTVIFAAIYRRTGNWSAPMSQQNGRTVNDAFDQPNHPNCNNDENVNPDDDVISSSSPSDVTICQTTQYLSHNDDGSQVDSNHDRSSSRCTMVRHDVTKDICKGVIRCKLMKRRHLIIKEGINPLYLKKLFPTIIQNFQPQHVKYNGGIANITTWKISCYLEVMDHGVPTTQPNVVLLQHCLPLLNQCNDLFLFWYQQQHNFSIQSQNEKDAVSRTVRCRRLMTFITRYTPAPNEQALLKVRSSILFSIELKREIDRATCLSLFETNGFFFLFQLYNSQSVFKQKQHIDGAGKVDGSVVVALPIDEWTAPYEVNDFNGGGLTFWDGPKTTPIISCSSSADGSGEHTSAVPAMTNEIHYDTRSGDIAFIDRYVIFGTAIAVLSKLPFFLKMIF